MPKPFMATLKWLPLIGATLIADQVSKWLMLNYFTPHEVVPVLPSFNLRLAFNKGVAFSLLDSGVNMPILLAIMTALITLVLCIWLYRIVLTERMTAWALSLIISGAVGNLIDRVRLGQVVDFLDFYVAHWHWPTFNLADTWICIGAFILVVAGLFPPKKESLS